MKKDLWNAKNINAAIQKFQKENQRYPTARDFDTCEYLPTSRQIQRRFGGLVSLRRHLGLGCPENFTKGQHSSNRAHTIAQRSNLLEKNTYSFLVNLFGKYFVHREFLFDANKRVRTDFFVYTTSGGFAVDVFYPKDRYNLIGCLNSKLRTYDRDLVIDYPVIFLMLNEEVSRNEINGVLEAKIKKLTSYQQILNLEEFTKFCSKHTALSICGR